MHVNRTTTAGPGGASTTGCSQTSMAWVAGPADNNTTRLSLSEQTHVGQLLVAAHTVHDAQLLAVEGANADSTVQTISLEAITLSS